MLDAKLRDKGVPVRQFWPDGAEREVTLVYSACGCPVKVMARRVGGRTTRTKDLPVIILSGSVGDPINALAQEHGVQHCVSKPYDCTALVELVKTLLKSKGP